MVLLHYLLMPMPSPDSAPSRGPQGPVGISTSEAVAPRPAPRPDIMPPVRLPNRPLGRRRTGGVRGRLAAVGLAAATIAGGAGAYLYFNRGGGPGPIESATPTEPAPTFTPEPTDKPTQEPTPTVVITPEPTSAPTPTPTMTLPSESPTWTASPSATATIEVTPTPTPSPTEKPPIQTTSLSEILKHYDVEFDAGGELRSTNNDLQINYSRALLDGAGIASISVDPSVMQKVHDTIVSETYKAARTVGQKGDTIGFGDSAQHLRYHLDLGKVNLIQYALSRDQYLSVRQSIVVDNKLEHVSNIINPQENLMIVEGNNVYILVQPAGQLDLTSVTDGWDRQDAATRVVFNGAVQVVQDLKLATLETAGDEFTLTPSDPVYEAFGLNASNNWGYTGAVGDINITYN